jgi:hypothetical protein
VGVRLHELGLKHGTDKATWHGYTHVYDEILSPLRNEPIRFLELGWGGYNKPRGGGESARMWREYFTRAVVEIVEVQAKEPDVVPDGVTLHHGSQDDRAFLDSISTGGWDVVVDDASHVNALTIRSLQILWPHLTSGGWYLIEDLVTSYLPEYGGNPTPGADGTAVDYLKRLVDEVMRGCRDGRKVIGAPGYAIDRMLITANLVGLRKA